MGAGLANSCQPAPEDKDKHEIAPDLNNEHGVSTSIVLAGASCMPLVCDAEDMRDEHSREEVTYRLETWEQEQVGTAIMSARGGGFTSGGKAGGPQRYAKSSPEEAKFESKKMEVLMKNRPGTIAMGATAMGVSSDEHGESIPMASKGGR